MADSSPEKLHMYHFGTLRWQPTAKVVYQTACCDLVKYREKPAIKHARAVAKRDGASPNRAAGSARSTAFLPIHLRDAKTASDVLRAAIKGIKDGQKSRNVETLTMYQCAETLHAALTLSEIAERDSQSASAADGQALQDRAAAAP